MKQIKLLLLPTLFAFLFIGCLAQPSIKRHVEGLSPDQFSVVKTENDKIAIIRIDGEKSVGFLDYWLHNMQWAGEASLKPGLHYFYIKYSDGHKESLYTYSLETQPGHTYLIKHQIVNWSIALWFEDLTTNESVGKVFASRNEPITDHNKLLDHSVYFTMKPPREDGWIIVYRNRNGNQTALAKQGNNPDESFAINVVIFEIPSIGSKEEFIKFVGNGREKDTDSKRLNIIKNDIAFYDGHEDYCVSYHSIAEDKEAVKQTNSKDSMILEMAGYVCRHPINKNIGINFDYSERYYRGHEDEHLTEKAKSFFELLTFAGDAKAGVEIRK